jgi:hypothetical protein
MIFIVIYIYSYVYLCIYTPSYQLFKAFSVSKFNSEISFLYQLFKENSNFIVKKLCKVICLLFMMSLFFIFIYTYIYTPSTQVFCTNFSMRSLILLYLSHKRCLISPHGTTCTCKLCYTGFTIIQLDTH